MWIDPMTPTYPSVTPYGHRTILALVIPTMNLMLYSLDVLGSTRLSLTALRFPASPPSTSFLQRRYAFEDFVGPFFARSELGGGSICAK